MGINSETNLNLLIYSKKNLLTESVFKNYVGEKFLKIVSGWWSERLDLNQRPHAPQACALPGCATLRLFELKIKNFTSFCKIFNLI